MLTRSPDVQHLYFKKKEKVQTPKGKPIYTIIFFLCFPSYNHNRGNVI